MQRAGLFWKLFLSTALLCIALTAALLLEFSSAWRRNHDEQFDLRLRQTAALVRDLLGAEWPDATTPGLTVMLRRIERETGARVTVVAASGVILSDSSSESAGDPPEGENIASRVEIVQAIASGAGWSTRRRPGDLEPVRYCALAVPGDRAKLGYVRAAMPIARRDAEMARGERRLWLLGFVTMLCGVGICYAIASFTMRPLAAIQEAAEAIASGDYQRRLPYVSRAHDEISRAAQSLYEVGARLASREHELRSASQTQATVLESMTEGVIAINRDLQILFANTSAATALGLGDERLQGVTLIEAVRSHELHALAEQVLGSGGVARVIWQWQARKSRIYDVLAAPLPGEPCRGVVLVLRDVSDEKRLEDMRQQFVANVSHELKTPLSSIKAFTETLLGGTVDDLAQQRRFLTHIDQQADRLHQLIGDMLSLARIESEDAEIEVKTVAVDRVVNACLAYHRPMAETRKIALRSEIEEADLAVCGDEEGLRQILDNLIDNAIKYTPEMGSVTIRVRRAGDEAEIEVADTGIGIAREHHERLFERFYRVDKARSRELGGTGLGLSIVKHLCQSMGGRISIASELGRGTVFRIVLPAAAPAVEAFTNSS